MAGEWATALGAAILGGQRAIGQHNYDQQQQQQQDYENRLKADQNLRAWESNKRAEEEAVANKKLNALQTAITQRQVDNAPRNEATSRIKTALDIQGDSAYDSPETVADFTTAGMPLKKGYVPQILDEQGVTEYSNAHNIAPHTGIELPESVLDARHAQASAAQKAAINANYQLAQTNDIANRPAHDKQQHQYKLEEIAAEQRAKASADPMAGLTGTGQPAGVSSLHGDEYLKTLDPRMQQAVKAYANYQLALPTGMARKALQPLFNSVMQYDPTFDEGQYSARVNLRKDYTSGPTSRNIQQLNAAVKHLTSLRASGDALNNTRVPLVNMGVNFLEKNLGDGRQGAFNSDATAVSDELAKYFRGSGTSDAAVHQWRENLSQNASPEQQQKAIDEIVNLMEGQYQSISNRFETGMGKPADFKILTPETANIFNSVRGKKLDAAPVNGPVLMMSPDGSSTGLVQPDQVQAALAKGAKIVKQ